MLELSIRLEISRVIIVRKFIETLSSKNLIESKELVKTIGENSRERVDSASTRNHR